jgi:chemotaxis protein methyltransferase CheR
MSDDDSTSLLFTLSSTGTAAGTRLNSIGDYWRFLQDDPRTRQAQSGEAGSAAEGPGFFDDPVPFDLLAAELLPQLAARRLSAGWNTCTLWNVGCGTGEDAYSLALAAEEALGSLTPAWPWRVEASDPCPRALRRARIGIYSESAVARVPVVLRAAGFERGFGPQSGRMRVRSRLQANVTFRELGLLDEPLPFREGFHVILCRRALESVPADSRGAVQRRIVDQLSPGGYLISDGEVWPGTELGLQRIAPAVYRRPF